jgi:hypothetical protein
MLQTLKRGLFVGTAVAVVAALCSASALAARGPGHFGPRGAAIFGNGFGPGGPMGPGMGMRGGPGFGPGFGMPGMRGGPGMHMRGPGGPMMRGGGGLLAAETLKTAAGYLGVTVAALQADLKAGKTLADEATAKGKTPAGLIKAITDAAKDNLGVAVGAGWLTQAQADRVLAGLTEAVTDLVNNGPGIPKGDKAGPLGAAATYLGMTPAELRTALRGGKTLAQVASDKGKSVDGLVTALTAGAKKHLDAAVAAGDITQAQATAALKRLTEHVTDFVNGVRGPKAEHAATNAVKNTLRFVALHR